jgi:hypothetical protein
VPKLPWGKRIDQHKSIAYAETEERLTVPFTVRRGTDNGRVTFHVSGHCPACGGMMTKEFSYGIVGIKGYGQPSGPAVPAATTLYCECGHVHADKPANATDDGCGRYWLIDLTAS